MSDDNPQQSGKIITPRTLRGFRDFLPEDMIPRIEMIGKIEEVYRAFGFVPLETPTLELADVLLGKYGEEANSLMYIFQDRGNRDVGMRYDLTVPLSRVVAQHQSKILFPFKRYQVAPVFRAEKPQKGRYREFVQFDVDVVGSSSIESDAEIAAIICRVMQALGIERFELQINNRKVLNALFEKLRIDKIQAIQVFRAIDKLEKVGRKEVMQELTFDFSSEVQEEKRQEYERYKEYYPDAYPPLKLSEKVAKQILDFIAIESSNSEILRQAEEFLGSDSLGVVELKGVVEMLSSMGIKEPQLKVKLSMARGLDYYTGIVYETVLLDLPGVGSIFSGGRFDDLISQFLGRQIPAVGASIGVDRLFTALSELGLVEQQPSYTDVVITNIDPSLSSFYAELADQLRKAGINTEIYLNGDDKLGRQLRYASDKGSRFAIICGGDEKKSGIVQLKDLDAKKQEEIPTDQVVDRIKKQLS